MKHTKGFTLIEVVIVISLLMVFSYNIGSFIFTATQSWLQISGREPTVNNTRVALNRMLLELRRIKKPQNITIFTTSECQFLDLDNQTIDYKQTGANLMRNADVMSTGLSTPTGLRFTYLDANSNQTATKQSIRCIRVWLSVLNSGRGITLESSARLRNL